MTSNATFQVNAAAASLRVLAVEQLRKAIIKGHLRPGLHLTDRELGDMLAVSRAVVREAVRQLEVEGLIVTVPHKGSFVNILSIEEARQIYDVRGVLEALAAKNFARDASEAQIQILRDVLAKIKMYKTKPEADAILELKRLFYGTMLSVPSNEYARTMLAQIFNRITQLRATSVSDPRRLPQTIIELTRLVNAIRRRDEQEAWEASIEHVKSASGVAIRILTELNERSEPFLRGRRLDGKAAPSVPDLFPVPVARNANEARPPPSSPRRGGKARALPSL